MRLCCDENIKFSVFSLLKQEGFDVVRVQDELELAAEDENIVDYCVRTNRAIITNDTDFLDIRDHPGVLFLEEQTAAPRDVVEAIKRIDELVEFDELSEVVMYVPDAVGLNSRIQPGGEPTTRETRGPRAERCARSAVNDDPTAPCRCTGVADGTMRQN